MGISHLPKHIAIGYQTHVDRTVRPVGVVVPCTPGQDPVSPLARVLHWERPQYFRSSFRQVVPAPSILDGLGPGSSRDLAIWWGQGVLFVCLNASGAAWCPPVCFGKDRGVTQGHWTSSQSDLRVSGVVPCQ